MNRLRVNEIWSEASYLGSSCPLLTASVFLPFLEVIGFFMSFPARIHISVRFEINFECSQQSSYFSLSESAASLLQAY